jgi:hypothetical protein
VLLLHLLYLFEYSQQLCLPHLPLLVTLLRSEATVVRYFRSQASKTAVTDKPQLGREVAADGTTTGCIAKAT